jgi:hypothetical protein
MIRIDWSNDDRHPDPQKYLVDPDSDNESRWLAFRRGWSRYVNQEARPESDMVTWWETGMFCASVLGDVGIEHRKLVYKVLLAQFLTSARTDHWTDEQREEALSLL